MHASNDDKKDGTSFYKAACVLQFPMHNINNLIRYLSKKLRKENIFKMTIWNKGFTKIIMINETVDW